MSERLKAIKEKSKLRRQLLAPIVSINIFIAYVVKTHMNLCDLQKSPTQQVGQTNKYLICKSLSQKRTGKIVPQFYFRAILNSDIGKCRVNFPSQYIGWCYSKCHLNICHPLLYKIKRQQKILKLQKFNILLYLSNATTS